MKKLIAAACYVLCVAGSLLALPADQWDAKVMPPEPHNVTIYRGETYVFEPRLQVAGSTYAVPTNASVTLYWTTNNWATAPYGTNGTVIGGTSTGRVRVTWNNNCDVGANAYQYFVGITETNGLLYRLKGTITMLPSPSWNPSTATPALAVSYPTFTQVSNIVNSSSLPLPAGTVTATNQGVVGQSLFFASGSQTTTNVGYWATASGSGDMLKSEYDAGGAKQVVFTNDLRQSTNTLDIATRARDVARADTNGWVVSSHASFLTDGSLYATAAQGVAATNAEAVATNAYAISTNAQSNATNALAQAQAAQVTADRALTNLNATITTATNNLDVAIIARGYVTQTITNGLAPTVALAGYVPTNDARYLAALTAISNLTVISQNGTLRYYSDISQAMSGVGNNETLYIRGNFTNYGTLSVGSGFVGSSIIGIGRPIITVLKNDVHAEKAISIEGMQNSFVSGIDFRMIYTNSGVVHGNRYGIAMHATNSAFEDCIFQMEMNGIGTNADYSSKNLVCMPAENVRFTRCTIASFDLTGSNILYQAASHGAGVSNIVFDHCAFIGRALNSSIEFIVVDSANVYRMIECESTTNLFTTAGKPSIIGSLRMLDVAASSAKLIPGTDTLIRPEDCGPYLTNIRNLNGELDTLQTVVTRNGSVTSGTVEIDSANLRTNYYGGLLAIGGNRYQANGATASGNGAWANYNSTASGSGSWAISSGTASGNGACAGHYGTASGVGSWANYLGEASGNGSWANAYGKASGLHSWAAAYGVASNDYSFAFGSTYEYYGSHGNGTFNINPVGGSSGFWIGETNLTTILRNYVPTNDARYLATATNNGTVDHLYTANQNGYRGDELVSADFVRGLLSGGQYLYNVTNLNTINTNFYTASYTTNDSLQVRTYSAVTNGQYLSQNGNNTAGGIMSTTKFFTVYSPMSIESYVSWNYNAARDGYITAEFYVTEDGTNLIELATSQAQQLPQNIRTNKLSFILSYPTYISQNGVYVVRQFKMSGVVGIVNVSIYGSGEYPSHISFSTPPATDLGIRGGTNVVDSSGANSGSYNTATRVLTLPTAGQLGALTNAIIKPITVYQTTNPAITLSEGVNAWNWLPPTNATLSPTFVGPGAGWAGSGMLRLVRTNDDNTVVWPTNATWYVNGTRTTNAPTLNKMNRIVVEYFDQMWTLGLISTNAGAVP